MVLILLGQLEDLLAGRKPAGGGGSGRIMDGRGNGSRRSSGGGTGGGTSLKGKNVSPPRGDMKVWVL